MSTPKYTGKRNRIHTANEKQQTCVKQKQLNAAVKVEKVATQLMTVAHTGHAGEYNTKTTNKHKNNTTKNAITP